MKVSYNWLKEYLECDLTAEQVAEEQKKAKEETSAEPVF